MLEHLERQKSLTANQYKICAAATIGDMLDFFDFYLIGFVLAFIVGGWHLTYGEFGAILLSSGIGAPLGSIFWGWMADRVGRRKVMILTVLNFSIATGAMAFTPEYGWLFLTICRFFVGMGVTGLYTVDIAIVQEFVPAYKRGWVTGLTTALLPAGTLLGALSGAFLEQSIGWRGLFVVGLLPAALTLLIRAWVPESPHWLIGKGRIVEARQSLAWALQVDPATIQLPSVAVAAEPVAWRELFKYPRSLIVSCLTGISQTGTVGLSLWMTTLFVLVLKIPPREASYLVIWVGAISILGRFFCCVDVGRAGPAAGRGGKLRDCRGNDVGGRLSQFGLYRWRLHLLCDDPGAELLRQRQLCDRGAVHGRGLAVETARQRHGVRLRFRQPGKVHRPGRAGGDRRVHQFRHPESHAGCAGPGDELFRLLVFGCRRGDLVHRHRNPRTHHRGNR